MIGIIIRNTVLMMILILITYTLLEQNSESFVGGSSQPPKPSSEADELYNFVFSNAKPSASGIAGANNANVANANGTNANVANANGMNNNMQFFRPYDTLDSMYATFR